jgi:uncharacterized protein involved in outer membrane biogenesis
MPRFIKFVSITLLVVVIGLSISSFLLSHFIDPNQYKDRITTLISEKSGYQVTLGGNISWSLFPYMGFSVENIALKARADETDNFMTLKQATISVKLLPLLDKQIQIDAISIDGLSAQLVVDQRGAGNWQTNPSTSNKKAGSITPNVEVVNTLSGTETKKPSSNDMMIDIAAIDVKNTDVTYENTLAQQLLHLTDIAISSKNISPGGKFPINIAFNIDSKKPAIKSHIDVNAEAMINTKEGIFNFLNLIIKGDVAGDAVGGKTVPLMLSGNINVDQSKQLASLSQMILSFSNMKINTNIEYNLRNKEYKGDLSLPPFDLNAFRESITQNDDSKKATTSPAMLAIDAQILGNEQYAFLNNMQILLNDMPLTGRVGISSFITNTLDITLNAAQVEVEKLLMGLNQSPRFNGLLNFSTHLTLQSNAENPVNTLAGNGQFEILNGKLKGENITQKLCDKIALLNKTTSTQARDTDTAFDALKGSFGVSGGVLRTNDIVANMKGANINSHGSSNLADQTLAFNVGVVITGDSSDAACSVNENYQNISLPILCQGKYDTEPGKLCSVDEKGLADVAKGALVNRASQKLEEKFGARVNGVIDKLFGK